MNAFEASVDGSLDARGVRRVPLVPIRGSYFGPLVLARRWRTFLAWSAVFLLAWVLLASDRGPGWNAFALGLMFPGSGLLYAGGWGGCVLAMLGLLAIPVAVINWFSSGNITAVFAAWLGGAALSGWYAAGDAQTWGWVAAITPYAALAVVTFWAFQNRRAFAAGLTRAHEHNASIARIETPLLRDLPSWELAPELTPTQLQIARVTFDKALQPLNRFDGFELDAEQWQMRATRYQLYGLVWTIANLTCNHTPSFTGYAREGIANAILKNLDRRIWGFWRWENLWGNWDGNPDPIRRDNIMITGFIAQQIGLFESLTGDRRFDASDALVWRWDDNRQFRYGYQGLIDALVNNYARYDFSWYPCEPGLIYSMCNIGGFNALMIGDRLRGTDHWKRIEPRVAQSFEEELMLPDGRAVCLVFEKAGLHAPTINSVVGETAGIPGLMAMWPDKAERLWHVIRRQFCDWEPGGRLKLKLVDWGWDTWDATNLYVQPMAYRPQIELRPVALMLNAAVEMGDEEVVAGLTQYIDAKFGPGVSMAIALGRRKGGWRSMIVDGLPEALRQGPRLAQADYPDVLVARAISDGRDLHLVLYPGAGDRRVRLGLDQLVPGKSYRVQGALAPDIVADPLGCAGVVVDLHGRSEVRILPIQ
ncbi:MAG: hypothetical protein AB7Q97_22025 [Gammaproteobacteria bacterium]